jgi:hypothetical protein
MSANYIRAVPTINLADDELAAVTAAIRGVIEGDRFPHAPRLDPLRAALARLEAAAVRRDAAGKAAVAPKNGNETKRGKATAAGNPAPALPSGERPHPKAPPPAKADKRTRVSPHVPGGGALIDMRRDRQPR